MLEKDANKPNGRLHYPLPGIQSMKLVAWTDIENKGPHSFVLFFPSLKRKSLFFGSCYVFKMTWKIGRTKELQNWRVICQMCPVCTHLLLQEERDGSTVCGIDSEFWLDHLRVFYVSDLTHCLCAFSGLGGVGNYFTVSNMLWELLEKRY